MKHGGDLFHIYIHIYIYTYIHKYIHIVVELRTPAMPFGLEAFVAVKLRSLCWQEIRRKCDQVPGERQSAAGSGKQEGRQQTCVCTLPALSRRMFMDRVTCRESCKRHMSVSGGVGRGERGIFRHGKIHIYVYVRTSVP